MRLWESRAPNSTRHCGPGLRDAAAVATMIILIVIAILTSRREQALSLVDFSLRMRLARWRTNNALDGLLVHRGPITLASYDMLGWEARIDNPLFD